eukprot:4469498-Pleurochrysis_carterae.AAC.1
MLRCCTDLAPWTQSFDANGLYVNGFSVGCRRFAFVFLCSLRFPTDFAQNPQMLTTVPNYLR